MNSVNNLVVKVVELMPKSVVHIFANKYIAGDTLDDAVKFVKELNKKGIFATMDVLGESIKTKDEALAAKKECLEALNAIHTNNLKANLSIKPTQFGLMLDEDFCYENVKELVEKAKSINNFIRLDMEDSATTDKIINLYKKLRLNYTNVGVVLQSYLHRTLKDVQTLGSVGTNYRLCKGIYVEPEQIAFKDRQEIRDNYMAVLREMFANGSYVGIATHDEYLIDESEKLIQSMGIKPDQYEYQMLMGVREDLRDKLNARGKKVRIYVPYGKDWYKYSIRRLKENPKVAMDIAKNIF